MKASLALLVLALVAAACAPARTRLALAAHHLRPLDPAHGHYELWAETPAGPVSAGRLTPATTAAAVPARGVTALFLTQEPPDDADPAPSRQLVLRGEVAGGKASLVPGVTPAAVAGATGAFLLDNPVTVDDPTDRNGVWLATYMNRRYKPGVRLYDAPDGWLWAGWVIYRGHALRMGKFRNGGDNDDWAGYSGRKGNTPLIDPAGRPMPGEDFIANLPAGIPTGRDLPDLAGATVLVTLEHATLAHEERWPSPVVIFEGTVPPRPVRLAAYPLANRAATLPSIDATLE